LRSIFAQPPRQRKPNKKAHQNSFGQLIKEKENSRENTENKNEKAENETTTYKIAATRAHHKMEGAAVVARTLKALEVTDVVRTL
jgi:hypothetical protein